MRFIIPIFLIILSIGIFIILVTPKLDEIKDYKELSILYKDALKDKKFLGKERDKLTQKWNSISDKDKLRLERMLPNNVDNIRLLLEIQEKIASPYGFIIKDISFSDVSKFKESGVYTGLSDEKIKDYGFIDLNFSIEGPYNNFISFIKDLENNLRLIDIISVEFSSSGGESLNQQNLNNYKYEISIRTYWLKN